MVVFGDLYPGAIFERVDRFFQVCYTPNSSRIMSSVNNMDELNKFLSPVAFYNVLAVPPKSPDPLVQGGEEYKRLVEQGSRHSEVLRKIYPVFQEGSLNKRFASLAEQFVKNYAENFAHYRLCADTLWEFKEKYLEVLYKELIYGDLPKDNNPKRKHPATLVKERCQILAKNLYENEKALSARDIAKSSEMKKMAQRPYRESGREIETKAYSYRKILEWVKEALPDDTHPKSGRPKDKPRPR